MNTQPINDCTIKYSKLFIIFSYIPSGPLTNSCHLQTSLFPSIANWLHVGDILTFHINAYAYISQFVSSIKISDYNF
jgi:hypothetical protein